MRVVSDHIILYKELRLCISFIAESCYSNDFSKILQIFTTGELILPVSWSPYYLDMDIGTDMNKDIDVDTDIRTSTSTSTSTLEWTRCGDGHVHGHGHTHEKGRWHFRNFGG